MQVIAKMSSKGQIAIPQAVREVLGICKGDLVLIDVIGPQERKLGQKQGNADAPCPA